MQYLEQARDSGLLQKVLNVENLEDYDFNTLIDSFKSVQGTLSPQTLLSDLLNNYAELTYSKIFEVSQLLKL